MADITAIQGDPTPEEVAAIMAAVELSWPRPSAVIEVTTDSPRWRFSGRWWAKPAPLGRRRPW
jgi:hypothetical protein